jgi:hypothetical protein
MSIEAMKQALEALRCIESPLHVWEINKLAGAMNALRQAIEFAEMVEKGTKAWADTPDNWVDDLRGGVEAVAWMWKDGTLTSDPDFADGTWTPLFTAPPKREWVGLTDEEIQVVVNKVASGEYQYSDTFARAIEAKLKEKNHG